MDTPHRLRAAETRVHELGRRITGLLFRIDDVRSRVLTRDERRAVLDAESFLMRARVRLEAHGAFILNAWRAGSFRARDAVERLDALVDELREDIEELDALPLLEPREPGNFH